MFWNIRYAIKDNELIAYANGMTLGEVEEYVLFEIRDVDLKQKLFKQIEEIRNAETPELER